MGDEKPVNNQAETQRQEDRGWGEWRERRHREPWRGLFWGLGLILLGVLLFSANRGWLSWDIWWEYFLIGLGVIFLIDAAVRYTSQEHRHGAFGRVIPGVVLICVGVAFIYGWSQWWPLILVAAGIVVLIGAITRRR